MRPRQLLHILCSIPFVAIAFWLSPQSSAAQNSVVDSLTSQTIRSTRGYMIRIPAAATLDSSRSGWSPRDRYEVRVYTMPGVGEIRLRVEIGKKEIPEGAVELGSYLVIDRDSISSEGTIYRRTWYLEHRRVEITLVPYGIAMVPVSDRREEIYAMFRWSDGADSEKIELGTRQMKVINPTSSNRLGG